MGRGRVRKRRRSKKPEKAKEEEEETSSRKYIPEEIILAILLLLPAESLLRFRCVSRQWCCLISPNVKQKVIFPYRKTYLDTNDVYNLPRSCFFQGYRPFQSIDQTLSHIENIDLFVGKNRDTTPCKMNAHVCGSCNGLLLIKIGTLLLLWDPSDCSSKGKLFYQLLSNYRCDNKYITKENKTLFSRTHLGLCYDSNSNDYKVLLALDDKEGCDHCTVMVGSFKTESWKQVKILFNVIFEISCVVVNGNLHWLVYDEDLWCETILCFDPRKDQFIDLPLPEQKRKSLRVLGLGVLDGCLSIAHCESSLTRERYSYDNTTVEVSVMKQYNVGESWTLLFRFKRLFCRDRVMPLFYIDERKRQVLMQIGNGIVAYDIDNHLYKQVANTSSATEDVAIVYEETTLESWKTLMSSESPQDVQEVDAQVLELSPMPEQVWKAPPVRDQIWGQVKVNCALPKKIWEVIGKACIPRGCLPCGLGLEFLHFQRVDPCCMSF